MKLVRLFTLLLLSVSGIALAGDSVYETIQLDGGFTPGYGTAGSSTNSFDQNFEIEALSIETEGDPNNGKFAAFAVFQKAPNIATRRNTHFLELPKDVIGGAYSIDGCVLLKPSSNEQKVIDKENRRLVAAGIKSKDGHFKLKYVWQLDVQGHLIPFDKSLVSCR